MQGIGLNVLSNSWGNWPMASVTTHHHLSLTVHLELVSDYSTDGFLAAYRWFISRRGRPSYLYSDCGTNFVGADRELKTLFRQVHEENSSLYNSVVNDGTQWIFNPPAAPHMGGKWEAVVKSIKFHLRMTIGNTLLTFEASATLLTQIEGLLNSRPLEPLSEDPEDINALIPGHFLIGKAINAVPEPSLLKLDESRLSRWQLIQRITQQFWHKWKTQYLQRLQSIYSTLSWNRQSHQSSYTQDGHYSTYSPNHELAILPVSIGN